FSFPPEKPLGTPGRPVIPFWTVLNTILYVLRTGSQCKAAPRPTLLALRCIAASRNANRLESSVPSSSTWSDATTKLTGLIGNGKSLTLSCCLPLWAVARGAPMSDCAKSGINRHLLIDGNRVPHVVGYAVVFTATPEEPRRIMGRIHSN